MYNASILNGGVVNRPSNFKMIDEQYWQEKMDGSDSQESDKSEDEYYKKDRSHKPSIKFLQPRKLSVYTPNISKLGRKRIAKLKQH